MRRLLVCLLGWLVPDDLFDVEWEPDAETLAAIERLEQ
jgi:hypothetical protein